MSFSVSANSSSSSSSKSKTKKSQKYNTQQLYRPPSARVGESGFTESPESYSSNASLQSSYSSDSRFQPSYSTSFSNVPMTTTFPIKGVLKRSKSFGNNNNNNSRNSGEFESTSLIGEGETGRFLLSLEGMSWEEVTLIKQALDKNTCASLDPCALLTIVRILCNTVMEKPTAAKMIASLAMEIHQKQQLKMGPISDHKYLFLESLASCLREWFNERDKLRFTTGGARRWTGYTLFLMWMYMNLKTMDLVNRQCQAEHFACKGDDDQSSDDSEDNCSNVDNNSADEEVSRAFSSEVLTSSDIEDSPRAEGGICLGRKQTSLDIEAKINNSVLSKQQKQFSNLLLDSFQAILSNPNSTPAEMECMQTAFRKCVISKRTTAIAPRL